MLHWSFVKKGLSISIFFKYQEYILCTIDLKHALIIDVSKLMLYSNSWPRLFCESELQENILTDEKLWKISVFFRPCYKSIMIQHLVRFFN